MIINQKMNLFRQQEHINNPRLRFLTSVKMNSEVVSKGYGPNKKEAKNNAVHMLLKIMCPEIYAGWKEKIKTH